MNEIEKILGAIDDAIAKFTGTIPGIQKLVYDELQPLMKQIQIKNGRILNNLDNLKLIGTLKNKLEKIIISADYKKSVSSFVDSFYKVSDLNNQYFAQFNSKYKAPETLKIIRELAVESTINELVGQGMKANVIDPVQKILNQNITTGGNYVKFQDEIRNHILSNDTGDGSMVRYTKQITTDAIHQYNAQYHETIAQDLQFNWGRYIGSNLTTSREFCVQLTKKQWVHKSELPEIIKGKIDDYECKLSKTTKLPLGMIPGTGADNFKIRRGGYHCGHQFFWVPDSSVPAEQLARFAKPKKKEEPAVPELPIKKVDTKTSEILSTQKAALDKIKKDKISIYEDLFDSLPNALAIERTNSEEAFYSPPANKIVIGNFNRKYKADQARNKSKYFRETLMAHEIGHAIHNQKEIISGKNISDGFASHFENLKNIIKGKESEIHKQLWNKYRVIDHNQKEQLMVLMDILGSLTQGVYGGGHKKIYYQTAGKSEAEIFAHSVSLQKVFNEYHDLNPEMNEVILEMKKKISEWL